MFFYPSAQEGLAWLEAGDDAWADRAAVAYDAAMARQDDGDPAQAQDPAP